MDKCAVALSDWPRERIDGECRIAYRQYVQRLEKHYTQYFRRNQQLSCVRHQWCARDLAAALPSGCSALGRLIKPSLLHRHATSAKSSQLLTLALIGSALQNDDSLGWFWDVFNLPNDTNERPIVRFEYCLSPLDLNEAPRVTKIDLVVMTSSVFAAIETKLTENGFGICSCVRDGDGNPLPGFDCSARVRSRKAYWETADAFFGIEPVRLPLLPCALSVAYQPIRVAAAARRLSRGRQAAFILIFDERNAYFRRTGTWPGWPQALKLVLGGREHSGLIFRALSWQQLVNQMPLASAVRKWAREKHQLP